MIGDVIARRILTGAITANPQRPETICTRLTFGTLFWEFPNRMPIRSLKGTPTIPIYAKVGLGCERAPPRF